MYRSRQREIFPAGHNPFQIVVGERNKDAAVALKIKDMLLALANDPLGVGVVANDNRRRADLP